VSARPGLGRAGALLLAAAAAATVALGSCHADLVFDELATCTSDPDCLLSSLHCDGHGQCVACTNDTHCKAPGFPRCDTALGRCVECGLISDCAGGETCRAGRCELPCTTSATCPASAPRCDDGFCIQCDDGVGCAGSPAGPVCADHTCVECRDDTTCSGATPRCDPVTRQCVACQKNADCPAARPLCDLAVGACAPIP
jgi:hypothetical protein